MPVTRRTAISSDLPLICSVCLPQHKVPFNNAGSNPSLKGYWTGLKVKADDLFDLVKSDSTRAGSIFSFLLTARLRFSSSSNTFCQLSPAASLFFYATLAYLSPHLYSSLFVSKCIFTCLTCSDWRQEKKKIIVCHVPFLLPFSIPHLCTCDRRVAEQRSRAMWWLEASCLLERQAQMHNLWRGKKKFLCLLCLASHLKPYISNFSPLLRLSSGRTQISSQDRDLQNKR